MPRLLPLGTQLDRCDTACDIACTECTLLGAVYPSSPRLPSSPADTVPQRPVASRGGGAAQCSAVQCSACRTLWQLRSCFPEPSVHMHLVDCARLPVLPTGGDGLAPEEGGLCTSLHVPTTLQRPPSLPPAPCLFLRKHPSFADTDAVLSCPHAACALSAQLAPTLDGRLHRLPEHLVHQVFQ